MAPTPAYAAITPPSLWFLSQYLPIFFWDCLIRIARNWIIYALRRGVVTGRLNISDSFGHQSFGQLDKNIEAAILTVTNDIFWLRILLSYDIGFSEAYMAGDFETPDLKKLLHLYVDNQASLGQLASPVYRVLSAVNVFSTLFFSHGISKSVDNVAGYNASNELYKAFLSSEMMYSCPIWGYEEGGVRGDLEGCRAFGDLEAAQAQKIAHILKKARLSSGKRVLEIGTGWGGLAIAAAKLGCTVDTITISTEQLAGARENIKRAGVQDKVRVHLMDYRHMPAEFSKAFDACISLEMLEAVGVLNMKVYLQQIDWALKDSDSMIVLTSTTYPESTYTPYQGNDFTRKYHWPNGVSPSATSLLEDFRKHVPRRFCVDSVEDLGDHYPRCLREWGRRFDENWTEKLSLSLTERHPQLQDARNMEMFRKKWHYMFIYMDVAYSRRWLGLTCWVMKRPGQDARICSS
ncbi:S-adenosyl-L-methionine-dependent methyltransferase [Mycena floridula]|nr:S-adenosyl-L-methionine-dependent methyltransferase [Mycena floridula]